MSHQKPSQFILRKLPLDDPRWAGLSAPWPGAASKVPGLLEALHSHPSFDMPRHSVWAELHDIIYHQYSCYESTYATVPYLVELGVEQPSDSSAELWISLGYIAGTYRVHGEPIPGDLAPAFQTALRIAESRCLEVLLSEPWNGEESCYLALAAVALSGHRFGYLLKTDLALEDSVRGATCPACGADFLFSLQDAGIATYRSFPKKFPLEPDETQPRRGAALQCIGNEQETPWQRVAEQLASVGARWRGAPSQARDGEDVPKEFFVEWRDELDAAARQCRLGLRGGDDRCVACVVGGLLALKGELGRSSRFLRLSGRLRCPSCQLHCDVVEAMEDLSARVRARFSGP